MVIIILLFSFIFEARFHLNFKNPELYNLLYNDWQGVLKREKKKQKTQNQKHANNKMKNI